MAETSEKTNAPRVFVYGTLKRGEANHYLLEAGGGTLLGTAQLVGQNRMVDLGWYPAVVRTPQLPAAVLHGEVYEVDDELLATLDILEGHPTYYTRSKQSIPPYKNCWVYMLPSEQYAHHPIVDGGKWSRADG